MPAAAGGPDEEFGLPRTMPGRQAYGNSLERGMEPCFLPIG
jgi:hypothetical protein